MILRRERMFPYQACIFLLILSFASLSFASYGDRLPEFRECVAVCEKENCVTDTPAIEISFLHRLLLWDCPSECDYTCQHIITDARIIADEPVVQFHGKWPFYRFLGIQEPFSVLFSGLNFYAHFNGLATLRECVPASYPLRKYYEWLAYFGMASWVFSMIFHTRDFNATEQLDYFAAGASVLYGMYYTPIRVFRLDQKGEKGDSLLRIWGLVCIAAYVAHVTYLKMWKWDYSYNITANVVVGLLQNSLWTWFSFSKYKKSGNTWAMLPGLVVLFILFAMSLELLDFPPLFGAVDAHSLWHFATIFPTVIWYNFLVTDALDDMAGKRSKA